MKSVIYKNGKIKRHRERVRDAGGLGKCGAPSLFRSSDINFVSKKYKKTYFVASDATIIRTPHFT